MGIDQKYESSDYANFAKTNLFKDLLNIKLIGEKDNERKLYDLLYLANVFRYVFDFNLEQAELQLTREVLLKR